MRSGRLCRELKISAPRFLSGDRDRVSVFYEAKVEWAVIEVGMAAGWMQRTSSGRKLRSLPVSARSPGVSRWHSQGDCLGKGRIIKQGVPLVTLNRTGSARVIQQRCEEMGAPLFRFQKSFQQRALHTIQAGLSSLSGKECIPGCQPVLAGEHQLTNAALAIKVTEIILKNSRRFIAISGKDWEG